MNLRRTRLPPLRRPRCAPAKAALRACGSPESPKSPKSPESAASPQWSESPELPESPESPDSVDPPEVTLRAKRWAKNARIDTLPGSKLW